MEVVHISQAQLAARWQIAEATLERWRSKGIGPRFLKLLGTCATASMTSRPSKKPASRILVFLSLPSAEMAIARVAQGGHSIPESVIRRRFETGLKNFHEVYQPLADAWTLHDNSDTSPVLIDRQEHA
jgi:hypothetical protein